LFGLAVFLVGLAVTVCVAVLVHLFFGGDRLPAHFGASAMLGSILVSVNAMKDEPKGWARRRKWIVAAIPVSCASTLGAVIAGQIPGLLTPTLQGGVAVFLSAVFGAALATTPAIYLAIRRLKMFGN
jgi:ABC-type multidrug transport system permease subunit